MKLLIVLSFHTVTQLTNYHQERCILQGKGKITKDDCEHFSQEMEPVIQKGAVEVSWLMPYYHREI